MALDTIQTDKAPRAVGPYSQAMVCDGFVFCSGQIALEPKRGMLLNETIEDEVRCVMANLSAVLEAAGTSLSNVVRTTIYLTDMDLFPVVNDVYGSFFDGAFPARATVGVAALPKGARVEIDAIARVA